MTALSLTAALGAFLVFCPIAQATDELQRKVTNRERAATLLAEAGVADFFDVGEGIGQSMGSLFFVFAKLAPSPANSINGVYGVNPWTGDVWNMRNCHRLITPALLKSQATIRKSFTPVEMKQYGRLHRLKPQCGTEF